MIIFERNITPRIGKASTLTSNLAAQLPTYREVLGLPVSAYRAVGSGATGRVKLVIAGDSVAALSAAANQQPSALASAVEEMRADTNAAEVEQMKQVLVHHPPAAEQDADLAYGVMFTPQVEHITAAATDAVTMAGRFVANGARSAFAAFALTGPYAELTMVATFANAEQFDAWTASWLADGEAAALRAKGAHYGHPSAPGYSELWQRFA